MLNVIIMNLLIIEDEPASAQRLQKMAGEIDPGVKVLEILDSISGTVEWFRTHISPDLVLMDIHLADGLSFEIFRQVEVACPVIFTTAYDQYAIQAFKVNSIDYLLKPIKKTELADAFRKLQKTRPEAAVDYLSMLSALTGQGKHLRRIVIRLGQQLKVLEIKDLAYFYIEEKIVFAVNFKGDRYPVDLSLDQLEEQLDPDKYFRINRAFIVNMDSIEAMYTYSKARIKITLKPPCVIETVTSAERSAEFREWLKGR